MSIKPSSKHGRLPVVLILVVLVLDIHRRRHNKEKLIYVHNFHIIFGDLPLIQVDKALTLLELLLFRIFLEQRRYPQNGEISSQVSPPNNFVSFQLRYFWVRCQKQNLNALLIEVFQ